MLGVKKSRGPVKGHRFCDSPALDRALKPYIVQWGWVIILTRPLPSILFFWAGGSPIPPGVQPVRERGRRRFGCENPNSRQGEKARIRKEGLLSMSSPEKKYLGIDTSKEWIDAHLLPHHETWKVDNTLEALQSWIATLPSGIELALIEATGGLHNQVAALLAEAGIPVCIINPKAIHHFSKAMQYKAKTDALDAELIATFAQLIQPEPRALPSREQARLKELMTRRRQLVGIQTAEKNRLGTVREIRVRESITIHLAWIVKELEDIDRTLDTLLKCDETWREKLDLLTSVPGVGAKTARALLCEIPELGTLTVKSTAALGGLAPHIQDSGKHKGKARIQGGRSGVRTSLYMATLSAIRFNPLIRIFYTRLTGRGKLPMVALTACMRKLLTMLNAILRDQNMWTLASVHS
jgi:transposase